MKRLLWLLGVICLVLLGLMISLLLTPNYQPSLLILGDIDSCREVATLHELGNIESVKLDGKTYKAVSIKNIIGDSADNENIKQVLLIASDGFSSAIDGNSLDKSYITFTAEDGWRAVNPAHPINANACNVEKIVVVASPMTNPRALTIITPEQKAITTIGALFAGETTDYPYLEGTAEKETNGVTYKSTVYTHRTCITLAQMGIPQRGKLLIFSASGESILTDDSALFQLNGNSVDYISIADRTGLQDIRLILVDPPKAALSDLYYHVKHFQGEGVSVMLVFVRGLTESAYQDGLSQGLFPFLEGHFEHTLACGNFPMTEVVWRETVLYGMEHQGDQLPLAETRELDFDPHTFDQEISVLCNGFNGVVLIAPLPSGNEKLSYDVFCSLYFVQKN